MVWHPGQSSAGDLAACLRRMDLGAATQRELLVRDKADVSSHVRPLVDAVRLFDRLQIRYALVGGVAAMYYGRSRFTDDVDFVAQSGHQEVLAANPDAMRECHFDPSCTWKLYHDSGTDVDIRKDEFAEDIVRRAGVADMAGVAVRVADMHDLIAMKLRAGRFQDDYDVSEILKRHVIDRELLEARVNAEQLARFDEIAARVEREGK